MAHPGEPLPPAVPLRLTQAWRKPVSSGRSGDQRDGQSPGKCQLPGSLDEARGGGNGRAESPSDHHLKRPIPTPLQGRPPCLVCTCPRLAQLQGQREAGVSGVWRDGESRGELPAGAELALPVCFCLSPGGSQVLRKVMTTPQRPTHSSTPTASPQPLKPAPQARVVCSARASQPIPTEPRNPGRWCLGNPQPRPSWDEGDPRTPQPIPCP